MKKVLCALLCVAMLFSFSRVAYADGTPNIDSGGGGMGQGTANNSWAPGRDGVRVTVVRDSDNTPISLPFDFSNGTNGDVVIHFRYGNKIGYREGNSLAPMQNGYSCIVPTNPMPRIISTGSSPASIAAIRDYFCREGTMRDIALASGIAYEDLIGGDYKVLLEPIAYFLYEGVMFAMTATEAALYNKQVMNGLRGKMNSLTHKNLPLAMFLEVSDLGFPAWGGSTVQAQSDDIIIASLGLGIVRFSDPDPEQEDGVVVYRCGTEVITSVLLSTNEDKDPDNPAYATFKIGETEHSHKDIYIPKKESQLAWIKWRTPEQPCTIKITVESNCTLDRSEIVAKVVDMNSNPPPDPQANDRYDGFAIPDIPDNQDVASLTWGEWECRWHENKVWHDVGEACEIDGDGIGAVEAYFCDHGWWEYEWASYSASVSAALSTVPDEKNPTASGKTMKSGYGLCANVAINIYSTAPGEHITQAQNVVAYFPEFSYRTYWRLLERVTTEYDDSFVFRENPYSTYGRRVHFSPVWFPDGQYVTYMEVLDAWTPAGMLRMYLTDTLTIQDSLFDDWHIRPVK